MKTISVLGSTGSIGTQTLEVAEHLGNVKIAGLSTNRNIKLLEEQIRRFKPEIAAVADEKAALDLKVSVADTNTKVVSGVDGLCQVSTHKKAGSVVTSIVGIAGLIPTNAAIDEGKDILLANKETLVTAGDIIMKKAEEKGASIIPVDSEHSAIFQCMQGGGAVDRIILTASGGSFFGRKKHELENVTVDEALAHPNWSMGKKITIDSATLMNKGLEVIEAHHLFGIDYDNIEVVIHRESIIHSMVEFTDGSILAQLGYPDMRLPIHYAICYPERVSSIVERMDFKKLSKLSFAQPDVDTFRLLSLAVWAGVHGGTMPTVLNAANEAAVELFLEGKIKFLEIAEIVEKHLQKHKKIINPSLSEIIDLDRQIKEEILR
ncbi:MAG: 1-deoxy-D-xylulose-5-phosphate reductoisomerase [Eubacteriales bacterium]|jgi:1-deoxy-D-xylulose-5-phosphate reductoisomerase|nr:1-deoxy-D-xylulose-5-phosphate reductoisomerase [Eubacteriales bacterium]